MLLARVRRVPWLLTVITLALASVVVTDALALPPGYVVETIAIEGEPAPGTGTGTFFNFGNLESSSGAYFVFRADIFLGTTTAALYRVADGDLTFLRGAGDPAPGTGGGTYTSMTSGGPLDMAVSSAGQVVFKTAVAGGTATSGIFLYGDGGDQAIVVAGDTAPGTGGGTFSDFENVSINASGNVVFRGIVAGGTSSGGAFLVSGGSVTPVALVGDASPGTGSYTLVYSPLINDADDVAFMAQDGVGHIIVSTSGATSTIVVRGGDVAPGTGGLEFIELGGPPFEALSLDEEGGIAFVATLDPCFDVIPPPEFGVVPYACAVYRYDGTSLNLLSMFGDPDPTDEDTFRSYSGTSTRSSAGTAFRVATTQTPFVPFAPRGVYLHRDGQVLAIATETMPLPSPGPPAQPVLGGVLNGQGDVMYTAEWTPSSPIPEGLFVATRVYEPVPILGGLGLATLTAGLCGVMALLCRRRSRPRAFR